MDNLGQRIQILRERIAKACVECGRSESEITIVAASKTVPPEIINQLPSYSITHAAENRVQEFIEKRESVKGIDWHFIGTLQSNKVKYLIEQVSLIHSADKPSLIEEIQKRANQHSKRQKILIQINLAGEENKGGATTEAEIERLVKIAKDAPNIELKGFMGVFPKEAGNHLYKALSEIYNDYKGRIPSINTLSMGMSADIETAIKNSATIIRPGTAIFGTRKMLTN